MLHQRDSYAFTRLFMPAILFCKRSCCKEPTGYFFNWAWNLNWPSLVTFLNFLLWLHGSRPLFSLALNPLMYPCVSRLILWLTTQFPSPNLRPFSSIPPPPLPNCESAAATGPTPDVAAINPASKPAPSHLAIEG